MSNAQRGRGPTIVGCENRWNDQLTLLGVKTHLDFVLVKALAHAQSSHGEADQTKVLPGFGSSGSVCSGRIWSYHVPRLFRHMLIIPMRKQTRQRHVTWWFGRLSEVSIMMNEDDSRKRNSRPRRCMLLPRHIWADASFLKLCCGVMLQHISSHCPIIWDSLNLMFYAHPCWTQVAKSMQAAVAGCRWREGLERQVRDDLASEWFRMCRCQPAALWLSHVITILWLYQLIRYVPMNANDFPHILLLYFLLAQVRNHWAMTQFQSSLRSLRTFICLSLTVDCVVGTRPWKLPIAWTDRSVCYVIIDCHHMKTNMSFII